MTCEMAKDQRDVSGVNPTRPHDSQVPGTARRGAGVGVSGNPAGQSVGCAVRGEGCAGVQGGVSTNELIAAAEKALEGEGGFRYENDDDDCGSHACCLVASYKPHAADCWVPRLRAAVAAAKEGV